MKNKNSITFTTDFFNVREGENPYNPEIYGLEPAHYLQNRLTEMGITSDKIIEEDFGFVIPIKGKFGFLWIAVSNVSIYPQNTKEITWLCFVELETFFWKKWFYPKDYQESIKRVKDLEEKILKILNNENFKNVRVGNFSII